MPRDPEMRTGTTPIVWRLANLADPGEREALVAMIDSLAARADGLTLFHDIRWLTQAEDRSADDVLAYTCCDATGIRGYAPFIRQQWQMRFRLGELTLFSIAFERLHANGGPIIAATDGETATALATDLVSGLRPRLSRRQVVYFEGVVVGSPVDAAIASGACRSVYRVLEPSPRYERQRVRLPASFDEYLAGMKSQTRQNLRNARRKLEKHARLNLVRCSDASDVESFVQRAAAISAKTYQWRLLGLGLRDGGKLVRTLTAMAKHGFTRCYLLECDGSATAFMLGYLYRGTYYYVDVGFDPDWEKWSVGTVLHLDVMKDLIEGADRVQSFDFSSGTGVHKKRFANEEARVEASFVLFPAVSFSRAVIGAYRAVGALSNAMVAVLERLRLKAAVKRLFRRQMPM